MSQRELLESLFHQAVRAIPYDLQPTGLKEGKLEPDRSGSINYARYSEEFTFKVAQLFDMELVARGVVELFQNHGQIDIYAFMGIARNGDWEEGNILADGTALQGAYDLETETWDFWIDLF
jgi:hypothetical protein